MRYTLFDGKKDQIILIARVLLMIMFVSSGWVKLVHFSDTAAFMAHVGLPLPVIAAIIAVVMELVVGIALVVGFFTRPLALLIAIYTLATALIGHHYWTMEGAQRAINIINFYKNISIIGGLLLLCVAGPGKYSIDRK